MSDVEPSPVEVPPDATGTRSPSWMRWLVHDDPSGPAAARWVHAGLALVCLVAWGSLWNQATLMLGWKGLTPVQMTLLQARGSNIYLSWLDFPSHLFFNDTDTSIVGGCIAGLVLSLLALLGVFPRVMFALNAVLYLGYCVAAETFLGFQWDNMLVESCVLAALLSRTRPSRWSHWMGRILLFKVFFQSGLAKLSSRTGDWLDGSAMTHYYETAPIPTPLAWYAHNLPDSWHFIESWWALFFELVLALGVFFGRVPRTVALAAFVSFLVLDFCTANYRLFVALTAVLCVLLLPERPLEQALNAFRSRTGRTAFARHAPMPRVDLAIAGLTVGWVAASLYTASVPFGYANVDYDRYQTVRRWRVANAYHLFSTITTERIEPEFQTSPDGESWRAHAMVYKAGPIDRAPPFIAPYQPRVDFRLWFYGLSWERSTPPYVANLLRRICWERSVVQPLFDKPLPTDTRFVRVVFWDHHFTEPGDSNWWTRTQAGMTRTISCDQLGR